MGKYGVKNIELLPLDESDHPADLNQIIFDYIRDNFNEIDDWIVLDNPRAETSGLPRKDRLLRVAGGLRKPHVDYILRTFGMTEKPKPKPVKKELTASFADLYGV